MRQSDHTKDRGAEQARESGEQRGRFPERFESRLRPEDPLLVLAWLMPLYFRIVYGSLEEICHS